MSEESTLVLPASRDRLIEVAGDRVTALERLHDSVWALAPDPVMLEYCRLRVASLLGSEAMLRWRAPAAVARGLDETRVAALGDWDSSSLFDTRERAYLAFAEQFVTSVRHIDDAQVAALCAHDAPTEVCAFIDALYVLELTQRVDLVADAVLREEEVAV
jgi:alkylhydroperoxidase family enzyme